jgi:hypothetical protein
VQVGDAGDTCQCRQYGDGQQAAINGHLGATELSAFPAMPPRRHRAHTMLTGLLDQSALYGVLAEIEALSLDLLEVRQLEPQRKSPKPGDSRSP